MQSCTYGPIHCASVLSCAQVLSFLTWIPECLWSAVTCRSLWKVLFHQRQMSTEMSYSFVCWCHGHFQKLSNTTNFPFDIASYWKVNICTQGGLLSLWFSTIWWHLLYLSFLLTSIHIHQRRHYECLESVDAYYNASLMNKASTFQKYINGICKVVMEYYTYIFTFNITVYGKYLID